MSTIKRIANVIVPVADQDAELRFYTEVLGLDLRVDAPMGDAGRWIEVAPAGVETVIAICPPGPDVTPGNKQTGITLEVDDIDAFHARLKDGGVDIDEEVSRFGEGIPPLVWFRDTENNTLMAVQAG
jgi:predicted enzyme related to lactoylglutathione lyase